MEFSVFYRLFKKDRGMSEGRRTYLKMAIPNAEIASIYRNTVLTWFDKKIKKTDLSPLMQQ